MKICPEESELQPLQGRVKRTLMLGPEARGSDPGRTAPGLTKEHVEPGQHCACPSVLRLPALRPRLCSVALSLLSPVCGAEQEGGPELSGQSWRERE